MGKSRFTSREKEKEVPFALYMKKSKNKAGVLETTIVSCRSCGEEFCSSETCKQVSYDSYERENNSRINDSISSGNVTNEQYENKVHKTKKIKKSKNKISRKRGKKVKKIGSSKNQTSNRTINVGMIQKKEKLLSYEQSNSESKIRTSSSLQKKERKKMR